MNASLKRWLGVLLAAFVLLATPSLRAADVTLGRYFSDNMVLQREKPTVVRGSANPGAEVSVEFAGQKKTATAAEDGTWSVTLDPTPASAEARPLVATSNGKTAAANNVVVGDVVLVARQTSIDVSVGANEQVKSQLAGLAANPRLRAISIQTLPAAKPQSDLAESATTGWAAVDPNSAQKMSAAAFLLGRDLAASTDVPVGIVDLNMGPAFPISWLSREALEETEKFYGKSDVPGMLKRFDRAVELLAKGEPLPPKDILTADTLLDYPIFPAGGFNAVIAPLQGLGLKAAVVQLGNDYPDTIYASLEKKGTQLDRAELNRAYVQTYDVRKNGFRMEPVTLPRVPRVWRQAFGQVDLPMAFVVPPGSDLRTLGEHHREMRELQRQVAGQNPNIGLIVPGSENVPFSAEPKDEALVAQRSLAWVQGAVYGKADAVASGPMFDKLVANFNEATIHFKPGTAVGLKAAEGALDHFEVAGATGDYSPASATIDGETVRLRSDTVDRITRVRYNWNTRPNQGLVNAAGLPAMPFRSEKVDYDWFVTNEDSDLPREYSTPANEWEQNDVTLVNGRMKTFGYDNFSGWVGPVGIRTGPFGPNMGVREIKPGAPAEGKLFVDDMIYSANGKMLGEKAWEVMAAAVSDSETRNAGGKLVLGVRRDGKNIDVEITLPVMGSYSPTAPFDCPKTDLIISNLESWVLKNGADAGFLNYDAIFLLANGKPELQGYVRRIVYEKIAGLDVTKPIEPTKAGKSWQNSAEAYLLGEYYLATGDRNVLPALKNYCDRLAATQNELGGWRHNFPGGEGYGLIPNAGLPGTMGMYFGKEAGLDINERAFQLAVRHFGKNRAETGILFYGYGSLERPVPKPIDPADLANGKLDTYNGGISCAGILMGFVENYRAAHLCSFQSAFAWNNTFGGHGGNFWNNFWTPLGASAHGKEAFMNFWKNYQWYREMNRMFDGSIIQHESGKSGAGCGVALVAPRKRIQVVGAPTSPFSVRATDVLSPALQAYREKDYAGCEKLVNELIAGGTVGKDDLPTVEYLARQAREIQESIDADLKRMEELLAAGNAVEAKTFVVSLKAVMPEGDARLAKIEAAIAASKTAAAPAGGRKPKNEDGPADAAALAAQQAKAEAEKAAGDPARVWECLVTEIATDRSKPKKSDLGKVAPESANLWRLKVVEDISQAPAGWTAPGFDDSTWGKTNLPISWRMYHTALLRTTFDVKDKDAFDLLRLRGWLFRQQGIEIYLNGELIAKINNLEQKTGDVEAELKASALKHLKNGTNTLAVTTRHNWRWGMLSMHVYNDGFGFRLDARKK